MRLKVILGGLLFLTVMLVGCGVLPYPYGKPALGESISYGSYPAEDVGSDFGTHPNDVRIGNFYPGAIIDTWLEDDEMGFYKVGDPTGVVIHNKKDVSQTFYVYATSPTREEDGYVKAPDYVIEEWIFISDPYPTLGPYEVRLIPVAVVMPLRAEVFADKWEFQIAVVQQSGKPIGGGMTQRLEYKGRWLVDMR